MTSAYSPGRQLNAAPLRDDNPGNVITLMKTMTVARRIALGFAMLLLITGLIGLVAVWRMRDAAAGARFLSAAVAPQAGVAAKLSDASSATQLAVRSFALSGAPAQRALAEKHLAAVHAALADCRTLAAAHPELTVLTEGIGQAESALASYENGFKSTAANQEELARLRTELDASAGRFAAASDAFLHDQQAMLAEEIRQGLPPEKLAERLVKVDRSAEIGEAGAAIRIANFKAQALREPELAGKAVAKFDAIKAAVDALAPITRQPKNLEALQEITAAAAAYRAGIEGIAANFAEAGRLTRERTAAAEAFDSVVAGVLRRSIERTQDISTASSATLGQSVALVIAGLATALVAGVAVSFLLTRRLNRQLRDTSGLVTQGAIQIASASGQVSATSQTLAEGASEQAASLEEISSSLEELASTTRHNADNAGAAKSAADAARHSAEHGSEEMVKMQEAMAGIRQSSSDISKIIKTIDEIAFQTNILALNAAVEAARAGEAGAGFAVVADEVRTLAQRCAVAARETTEKISDATGRSEQGATLSAGVAACLQEIVTKSREVDRLVAEVATASREQSSGLEQVNTAVAQMDKVTQANAASAEESASAAEELDAQSVELRHAAGELAALVGLTGVAGADTPLVRPAAAAVPQTAARRTGGAKRPAAPRPASPSEPEETFR